MAYKALLITLPGKKLGEISVHPIIEVILCSGGHSGALVQVVPRALVVARGPDVSTLFIDTINNNDRHSAVECV